MSEARRNELLQLVSARGFVRVSDASDELGVSEVTIRADLTELESRGTVVRVHGGAMLPGAIREPSLESAREQQSLAKRAIGEHVAGLVRSGDSVFLDVGSTALAVANALVERRDLHDLVVVTNGLSIALALEAALPRFTVIVTGGTLRPLQHSLVNPYASQLIDSLRFDLAIIGCNGVDVHAGVTNVNLPETEVKRQVMRQSGRRVLIADGSKLGVTELGVVGPLSDFEMLITAGATAEAIASLRSAGLRVENA
ncbi:DeoR/GlpR family DNA-binding transcription regulator [Pseudolysinimonas sp.]|jgi:DeoR family transcriptional regulator of aga operon|uniref:DeoR/GlpR family DNA-binding transcription regulator n=1 Tax=Pseudolysinimonas sp. TaxID=2680009 RepID=UPI00378467CB